MKLYVIKRDDGKYLTETIDYLEEICFANIFIDYEVAKCYCRTDCKVIEIEIKEKK